MQLLSRECGLCKASDLLLGDHVCEKSDAVKLIYCLNYNWTDFTMSAQHTKLTSVFLIMSHNSS